MSHKKHQFTSRTKARKRAADVVYEADQRGMGRNASVLRDLLRERKVITAALTPLPDYSIQIIEGVADELYRIDRLIDSHARTGLDRVPAVDRAVLRVAVWEMLSNSEDVPPVIAIDEAISIVKSISTEESAGFVNAILDAIRRDIQSTIRWPIAPILAFNSSDNNSFAMNESASLCAAPAPKSALPFSPCNFHLMRASSK